MVLVGISVLNFGSWCLSRIQSQNAWLPRKEMIKTSRFQVGKGKDSQNSSHFTTCSWSMHSWVLTVSGCGLAICICARTNQQPKQNAKAFPTSRSAGKSLMHTCIDNYKAKSALIGTVTFSSQPRWAQALLLSISNQIEWMNMSFHPQELTGADCAPNWSLFADRQTLIFLVQRNDTEDLTAFKFAHFRANHV